MAEQQLIDYVKQQLQGGAKAEDIKKALIASGWSEADVAEAVNASLPSAMAVPALGVKPIDQQAKSPIVSASAQMSTSEAKISSVDSVVAHEVTFPKEIAEIAKKGGEIPGISRRRFSLLTIILVTLLVLSLGGNAYLFFNGSTAQGDLNQKVTSLTNANSQLSSQTASLTSQLADLTQKNIDLTTKQQPLQDMALAFGQLFGLQISTTTLGSSTIVHASDVATGTVQIKGNLGQAFYGKTMRFVIYDATSGLFSSVLNSSDIKVDAMLRQFVGLMVTVGGTHVAGSRDITVTMLNGDPL